MAEISDPIAKGDVNYISPSRLVVSTFKADPLIGKMQEQGLSFDFSCYQSRPKVLTLDHIGVEKGSRGNGFASKALSLLTELADAHGVTLDLDVGPDEAEIGLTDWYARHGFDWSDERNMMERTPQGTIGYHVTTDEALQAILQEGLIPQIGPRSAEIGEEEPRIYLFSNKEDVDNALSNWLGDEFDEEEALFVLEVDLSGIEVQRQEGQFEITVSEKIAPEKIVNVYDECFKLQKKKSVKP